MWEMWQKRKLIMELNKQKIKNVKIFIQQDFDILGINKIFIQKFFLMLWNNPNLMVKILNNVDINDLKENLAPFVVDNFYNNYLSGNYLENNLLYVFALMIKEEVDKLKDVEQVLAFLDNSRCGILLEQLIYKNDIQIYFRKMIFKTISKIENCSSTKINFNVNEINKKLSWLKSERTNDSYGDKILIDARNSYRHDANLGDLKLSGNLFSNNFLTDITTHYLEKFTNNEKNKENKDLFEYYNKLIQDIKIFQNPDLFSNSCLIKNLFDSNSPTDILAIYKEQITEIISFINQLIEDLSSNTFLIPHSIKCICKIISILIKQKFKNIKTVDINAFISKFFLGRLLIPIISSPSSNAYITDFVISENTLKNIKTTNKIILKLFSGTLFNNNQREGNYTSFNKFFLEKMPQILFFYEKATDVKLPNFIGQLLENKLGDDFEYDYFEQNKESIYTNISIIFNLRNLSCLINGIKNCSDFFEFNNKNEAKLNDKDKNEKKEESNRNKKYKLIFNRLISPDTVKNIKGIKSSIINEYLTKLQAELEEQKKKDKSKKDKSISIGDIECYFLFSEEVYESKYEYLFNIDNKTSDYFIDLKSLKKSNLSEQQKILINIKNYLVSTLGNYRIINISDFNPSHINNTLNLLEEIKKKITLPNFIINNNTVPSEWYINSLLDNMPLLDESYKKDDFLKLYSEIYQDLNHKIELLNFNFLIMFRNRIKFIDKAKFYYEEIVTSEKEIIINEKIKLMVESIFLPIEVQFKYNDEKSGDIFKIKFSNLKEKNFENKSFLQDNKKDIIIFKTIESFASNFPNLVEYQILQDENPLTIMSKLKIPKYLKEYFLLIREKIIKKSSIPEKIFDTLYQEKINNYFMNKIYDKIYPIEPETEDSEIYRKATMLSWVEPNSIINKDYIYETSLPDIIHEFQNVNTARTPQKKFNSIQKILDLVKNLIIFNEGDKSDISLDDATPVLFYVFIKAHPYKIFTDLEFIKLFLESKIGVYSFNIKQIESAINMLMSFNETNFGLTKEEFNKRCNSVSKVQK